MKVPLLERGTHVPKLMFPVLNYCSDHADQSFLQIVCDLCHSPYIQNRRIFRINLRRATRASAVSNFGPRPTPTSIAATKLAQQTNNKQTSNKDAATARINVSGC